MSVLEKFLPQDTGWRFSGSRGGGLGAQTEGAELSVNLGLGTYYVTDPGGAAHGLPFANLEVGVGISLSLGVNIFGSLRSFPSSGVGSIYKHPRLTGPLEESNLRSGTYAAFTISKGTVGASGDLSVIFMGIPWLSSFDPSIVGSLLAANAVGVLAATTARFEIGLIAISGLRGKIF